MTKNIGEDRDTFRRMISGKIRKEMQRLKKTGQLVGMRPNGKKFVLALPELDIPIILHGDNGEGVGRGKGKEGDVIARDPEPGQGNKGGQEEGEGLLVGIDMDELLQFMEDDLELPRLEPKSSHIFEDVQIKYNSISLIGPESLRHTRRTLLEALKRQCADGSINDLKILPGGSVPVRIISPIKRDKRYRQYQEIRLPSTNAVVIYARDYSGSMTDDKCEIVSDMAFWIDVWVRRFYKRVDRVFVGHDITAQEIDEEKFYRYRHGGGTTCSSAPKFISKLFENRYPPNKWNIYVFYFTDGENWEHDNAEFVESIKGFGNKVNLVGITQVMAADYKGSVQYYVDQAIESGELKKELIHTAEIGTGSHSLQKEERDQKVLGAIKTILGKK